MAKKIIISIFCLLFLSGCVFGGNDTNKIVSNETDTITQISTISYPDLGYPIIKQGDEDIDSRIGYFKGKLAIVVEVQNISVVYPGENITK